MKELELFFNNHYKTDQMMDWSELTEKQKQALEKSQEFRKYNLEKAIEEFRVVCLKEVDKLIESVKRFR